MGSQVTCVMASFLTIFSLLCHFDLDLRSGTGQTDRQTDSRTDRQTDNVHQCIMPHPMGRGIISTNQLNSPLNATHHNYSSKHSAVSSCCWWSLLLNSPQKLSPNGLFQP